MGLRLAQLERKFGEIDRARGIYMHIAQFNDPRYDDFELWKVLHIYIFQELGELRTSPRERGYIQGFEESE